MMDRNEQLELECRMLWKKCFGDSEPFMDYYFGEKCRESKLLTDIEDNHVVSMVYLNPYELMWKGKQIKSYYIVGVATEEKYRKQGRMRKLLEQAFNFMKEEQIPFTFLMPANTKIYEPFAFQTIYRQKRIAVKRIEEKLFLDSSIQMKAFMELTEEELLQVEAYCQKKLKDEFELYVARDISYYQQLQLEMKAMEGQVVVFRTQNGSLCGVLAYGLENGYLEIVECLIDRVYTKEIVELLLQQEDIADKSQMFFYESYFIEENILNGFGTELEYAEKDTIMVKMLTDEKAYQPIYENAKVYINELV